MKLILIGILSIVSFASFETQAASQKSKLHVFDEAQARFSAGKTPTEKELQFERRWVCQKLMALSKDSEHAEVESFEFSSVAGMVQNLGTIEVEYFSYETKGLIGALNKDRNGAILEVRVTEHGDLIAEYTVPVSSAARYGLGDVSIKPIFTESEIVVLGYAVCADR